MYTTTTASKSAAEQKAIEHSVAMNCDGSAHDMSSMSMYMSARRTWRVPAGPTSSRARARRRPPRRSRSRSPRARSRDSTKYSRIDVLARASSRRRPAARSPGPTPYPHYRTSNTYYTPKTHINTQTTYFTQKWHPPLEPTRSDIRFIHNLHIPRSHRLTPHATVRARALVPAHVDAPSSPVMFASSTRRRAMTKAYDFAFASSSVRASVAIASPRAATAMPMMTPAKGGVRAKSHHLGDFSDKKFHDAPLPVSEETQGGLKEYSVVYTDRASNPRSPNFTKTMQNLDAVLKPGVTTPSRRHRPEAGRTGWNPWRDSGVRGKSVGDSKRVLFVSVDGYF